MQQIEKSHNIVHLSFRYHKMSASQSRKRARGPVDSDDLTQPAHGPRDLAQNISNMDRETLETLLLQAAHTHRDVSEIVQIATDCRMRAEQERVIGFDHRSKAAWKAMNVDYSNMKGSHQYNMAGEVRMQIEG